MKNTFKRATAVVTTVVIILTLFVGAAYATFKVFPDAEGHWARETIEKLSQEGIVKGYPDGSVRPDKNITRSEFVSLLAHGLKYDEYKCTDADTFNDTDKHWAENMIEALVKNKIIIKEYYGKSFKPNQPIRRIEMIRMIVNSLGKADMVKSMTGDTIFIDDVYISKEDRGYINVAVGNGLSFGYPDKSIRPMAYSTRAEAFTMILRCLEAIQHVPEENVEKGQNNNSDNSVSYLSAKVDITLPNYSHTDTTFEVKTNLKNVKSLEWTIQKKDTSLINKDEIEGTLDKDGGKICIKSEGDYQLTAVAINYGNKKFTFSKEIKVYPVPKLLVDLPEGAHTDDLVTVSTSNSDMDGLIVNWFVDDTHGFQNWGSYIDGELTNNGGDIRFKSVGTYEIEARITDETGRVFKFKSDNKIEIYPVLSFQFSLPETAYTDVNVEITTSEDAGILPLEWSLARNGQNIKLDESINGTLNSQGGRVQFLQEGEYLITAAMSDALGRIFSDSARISIYPLLNCDFSIPSSVRTGASFEITVNQTANRGNKDIVWCLEKDGVLVPLEGNVEGDIGNHGGTVTINSAGDYMFIATVTDEIGRTFTSQHGIKIVNTAPTKPIANVSVTRNYKDGKFLVEISAISTDSDGDVISYEYIGKADDNYYAVGSYTIKVRAKDNFGGISDWTDIAFSVSNAAPTKPGIVADVIRNAKDGKFLVNISVNSTDADGDAITYEYDGKSQDNYYSVGANTVKVRAKDNFGGISVWSDVTFIIKSSEPTAPVITRTPNGNSVAQGTPVTITAVSTDADGDAITYVWDNRPSQSYVYPLGKNVVKVKAVDSTGAESPWSAIAFFVSDSTNGGGMTLTGPGSVIMENGIEGATITHYTFTVPPVSGHSGSDYGRVRGYNIKTNTWEQLDYRTTTNGITFEQNLPASTYSKLEFYYYTNHNCMYGKSNITYSVDYYFE